MLLLPSRTLHPCRATTFLITTVSIQSSINCVHLLLIGYYIGGMDAYVKEFGKKKTHDEFFTDKKIRKEFYKYIRFIVSRYANEPSVIAWELANDARCISTLPPSEHSNTNHTTPCTPRNT